MITGNEPARPSMANFDEEGEILSVYKVGCVAGNVYGLTIRQEFAARAMQAFISVNKTIYCSDEIVSDSVRLADKLIKELNET